MLPSLYRTAPDRFAEVGAYHTDTLKNTFVIRPNLPDPQVFTQTKNRAAIRLGTVKTPGFLFFLK